MHSNNRNDRCWMFVHDVNIAVHQFQFPIIFHLLSWELLGHHIEEAIDSVSEKSGMGSLAPLWGSSDHASGELEHYSCKINSLINIDHFLRRVLPAEDNDVFFKRLKPKLFWTIDSIGVIKETYSCFKLSVFVIHRECWKERKLACFSDSFFISKKDKLIFIEAIRLLNRFFAFFGIKKPIACEFFDNIE